MNKKVNQDKVIPKLRTLYKTKIERDCLDEGTYVVKSRHPDGNMYLKVQSCGIPGCSQLYAFKDSEVELANIEDLSRDYLAALMLASITDEKTNYFYPKVIRKLLEFIQQGPIHLGTYVTSGKIDKISGQEIQGIVVGMPTPGFSDIEVICPIDQYPGHDWLSTPHYKKRPGEWTKKDFPDGANSWFLHNMNILQTWRQFTLHELQFLCNDVFGTDVKQKVTLISKDGWVKELEERYGTNDKTILYSPSRVILGMEDSMDMNFNEAYYKKTDETINDRVIYRECD